MAVQTKSSGSRSFLSRFLVHLRNVSGIRWFDFAQPIDKIILSTLNKNLLSWSLAEDRSAKICKHTERTLRRRKNQDPPAFTVRHCFIPERGTWSLQIGLQSVFCFWISVAVQVVELWCVHRQFVPGSFDCSQHCSCYSGPNGPAEHGHLLLIPLCCCNSPHHTLHLCLPGKNNKPCYRLFMAT